MFLETTIPENQKQPGLFLEKQTANLKITERDLSIVEFLLEMKFAGYEELYQKFFPPAEHLYWGSSPWSRGRLGKLRNNGLIEHFQFPGTARRYFLATDKGRRTLLRSRPLSHVPWALKKPQYLHFDHDLMVLRVRLFLESQNRMTKWTSERFLKIQFGDNRENSIEKHNIPDGIYQIPEGRRIALEVEMSHKARVKYRKKIKFLVSILRGKKFEHFEFDQVQFLCKSKAVCQTLKEETRIYGDLFEIQTLEEFFNQPKPQQLESKNV